MYFDELATTLNTTTTTTTTPGLMEGLLKGILYGSMALVVSFINVMVIISYFLREKKNRGILDIFIASLAISSVMTSISVIGLVAYVRATHSERFVGKTTECYIQYFFGTMLRLTDVATTTGIATDRFLAVCLPMFYRNRVKLKHGYIACAVTWLSSALIAALPIIMGNELNKEMDSLCTADWTKEIAVVVLTVTYLQFLIVLICYIGIFRGIRGFVKRQKEMLRPTSTSQPVIELHERKVIQPIIKYKIASDTEDSFSSSSCFSSRPNSPFTATDNQSFESDITDNLVKMSQRNMQSALNYKSQNVQETSFETKITDRLVQLSRDNMKTALRELNVPASIEVKTSMTVKTKHHGDKVSSEKTSHYVNLRMKTNVNQVSFSDLPNEKPHTHQVMTRAVKPFYKERPVYESKNNTTSYSKQATNNNIRNKKEKKSVKLRRSFGTMKEKLKARKVRRSSSMRHFWKESQHFAKIMGVVVLLFYISWLPLAATINVVLVTGNQAKYHDKLWICYNLSLLSSVAIPLAYAVMCKPYRESYRRLWRCIFCRNHHK